MLQSTRPSKKSRHSPQSPQIIPSHQKSKKKSERKELTPPGFLQSQKLEIQSNNSA